MKINIREDSVEIDGYVNAVERLSKPLNSRIGKFRERIKAGAFKRAIERNDDIHVLLNHNPDRDLGSTKQGNLELREDNIGLRAKATITDADVIAKAKHGDLVGWSFGFSDRDVDTRDEDGMMTRDVKDLNLYEVSILDRSKVPAYDGTIIQARDANGGDVSINAGEALTGDPEVVEATEGVDKTKDATVENRDESEGKPSTIDYSKWENLIAELKED